MHRIAGISGFARGFALGFTFAFAAPGQAVRWKIPERGAVLYTRETELTPRGGRLAGWRQIEMPPVLLQGELSRRQTHVAAAPVDLTELAAHIAFDLRRAKKRGKFEVLLPFVPPFGALRIRGRTDVLSSDGEQVITAEITRERPERGDLDNDSYQVMRLARSRYDLLANIRVSRRVVADVGVVGGFDSVLEGEIREEPLGSALGGRGAGRGGRGPNGDGVGEFRLEESWVLARVLENRDRDFPSRVAEAIRRGAELVRDSIRDPDARPLAGGTGGRGRTFDTGRLALCLLTLVHAGFGREDPDVARGFDSLRRRVITDTYSLGLALMAMEALYAPPNEHELLADGHLTEPAPREPTPGDLELMREWTAALLENHDASIPNTAYLLRFHYLPGSRAYDNSNSQYALLGLYSAQLCGIDLSPTVWFACAEHWQRDRALAHGEQKLRLTTHREYDRLREQSQRRSSRRSSRTVSGGRQTEARGWPYRTTPARAGGRGAARPKLPTGSMTCAGVTGVTICEAVLRRRKTGAAVAAELREVRDEGYAWLSKYFSVRHNENKPGEYYYYLYGLERACELGRVALIGNRDWYFEGAMMLLEMQNEDGSFRAAQLHETCFAILFLEQAAPPLPARTGGAE